ncbi:TPA: type ISP restriction/modification enzyme, partial [Morganella morganii]
KKTLIESIERSIDFFNSEVDRYKKEYTTGSLKDFVKFDPLRFAWYGESYKEVSRNKYYNINDGEVRVSLYRPFGKLWVYFNKEMMHRVSKIPEIYPSVHAENFVICLTLSGSKGFSVLMSDIVPDLHFIGDVQCFPLYIYGGDDFPKRKYSINSVSLSYFKDKLSTSKITEEDVFYYVYGILHSEEYRFKYADNLTKELPRVPCVKNIDDFWLFSKAGRKLAELHVNYETVEPYKADIDTGSLSYSQLGKDDFYVEKMKFAKKGEKDTVIYNNKIRIKNIPTEAYDYVVNGKPALEWVMERQGVSTHKDSGIVNDANDWAVETMNNPRYPLELFLRIITVSLETQKIVNSLPKLDI